jgi:hypothetical protein
VQSGLTQGFEFEQTFPQAPQLFGSEDVLISQPSAALRLQSANPWLHVAI